jgi:arsenate reductase-like glutaredoxin family protein
MEKMNCTTCKKSSKWFDKNTLESKYVCKHPKITSNRGEKYGRIVKSNLTPSWCPLEVKE